MQVNAACGPATPPISSREARPTLARARSNPGPREGSTQRHLGRAPGDSNAVPADSDLSTPAGESDTRPPAGRATHRSTGSRTRAIVNAWHRRTSPPHRHSCSPSPHHSVSLPLPLFLSLSLLSLWPSRKPRFSLSRHSSPSSTPRHALFTYHPALCTNDSDTLWQMRIMNDVL